MNKNLIETITGAVVLGVAAWFLMFFMEHNTAVSVTNDHYTLFAKFEQADGISVGTPVRIGGVKVGVVVSEKLDPTDYKAIVKFSLNNTIKIPTDSTAKIASDGLIGAKYMSIVPGAEETMLTANQELQFTQSSVNLETLIGKMVFSSKDKASN